MKTRSAVILCIAVVLIAALSILTFAGFRTGKYTYMPLAQAAAGDLEYSGGSAVTVKVTGTDDPAAAVELLRGRFAMLYPSASCSALGSDMLLITDSRTGMAEYYENLATQKFRMEFHDADGTVILTKDDIASVTVDRYSATSTYFYAGAVLTPEGREKYLAYRGEASTAKNLSLYLDGQSYPSYLQAYDESKGMLRLVPSLGSENESYQGAQNLALYLTVKELDATSSVVYHGDVKSFARGTALTRVQWMSLIALAVVCVFLVARYRLNGLCAAVSLCLTGILALTVPVLMELTISTSSLIGLYAALAAVLAESVLQLSAVRREAGAGRTAAGAIDAGCRSARAYVLDVTVTLALGAMMIMYFGDANSCAFGQTLLFGTVFGGIAVAALTPLLARCLTRLTSAGKA